MKVLSILVVLGFLYSAENTRLRLNKFCPFTTEQCKEEPYNNLKSCQLLNSNLTKLEELSQQYLCSQRDKFMTVHNPEVHSRKRRSVCNLCAKDEYREIIYAAEDAQYGTNEVVELLHDPDRNLYQTYTVQMCAREENVYGSGRVHQCAKQWMTFKAAVITEDYDVRVQNVRYPLFCAFEHTC